MKTIPAMMNKRRAIRFGTLPSPKALASAWNFDYVEQGPVVYAGLKATF